MDGTVFGYIIYGFITGLSEFLPVSTQAHQFLLTYFTDFHGDIPFIKLFVYLGCILAILISCGKRLVHIYRELRVERLPKNKRNRMPDMVAVLDARLVFTGLIPIVISLVFANSAYAFFGNIVVITLLLILSGIAAYIPPYFPAGNRDSRDLTPSDGFLMGFLTGLSVIPGISRTGALICGGRLRGCDKRYVLELSFLYGLAMLLGLLILQIILLFMGGVSISWTLVLCAVLSGAASFAGAMIGIHFMRYLAVKQGFSTFAYYCWGLAVFCFVFYLIT